MGFLGNALGTNTTSQNYKDIVKVNPEEISATNIGLDPGALAQQQGYLQTVQNMAAGTGPSAASTMLKDQAAQNSASAMGMAANQRGTNAGLAMRQALQAGNQANQQAAQQAGQARVVEQLGAMNQYGSQANALQGQNLGVQQANQNANLEAARSNQTTNLQGQLGAAGLNTQIATDNSKNNSSILGGIISGVGQGAAAAAKAGAAHGEVVPGEASVSGDSPENDTVHTMLSPGEIVIPRSVSESPGFKEMLIQHVNKMHGEAKGFARVLAARKGV